MPFFTPRTRTPSVKTTWSRIEKWLAEHIPAAYESLNLGATTRQIAELESTTRRVLPKDLKESLLIHNGQADILEGVIFGLRLLPIDRIISDWEVVRRYAQDGAASKRVSSLPKGSGQHCESHPGWIPLTEDGSGNHLGVDLAQGIAGTWGQVINFGRDEFTHVAVSSSWSGFLADFMDELTAGNFSAKTHEDGTVVFELADPPNRHFCGILPALYRKRTRSTG